MSKHLSRRGFLERSLLTGSVAAASLSATLRGAKKAIPVGLEMYSVRDELTKDLMGTIRAVGKMGYQVMEFYAPYYDWTPEQAKDVRKLLDDLGVRCLSTHNGTKSFTADGIQKAIDLNQILGAKYIVMASPGRITGMDSWKGVAEQLTRASEKLKPLGMAAGYHNHKPEFVAVEGKRPIDILALGTPADVMLQLDVGTCVDAAADPVAYIQANPGRIRSIHCKDFAAGEGKGYKVLFGEGDAPWTKIFAAAESVGGVEYYLIEQEGSRYGSIETAERCLAAWKKMRS
jgi:sugar phosphate isomerase/epimerase